jgi:hypothetical protein
MSAGFPNVQNCQVEFRVLHRFIRYTRGCSDGLGKTAWVDDRSFERYSREC